MGSQFGKSDVFSIMFTLKSEAEIIAFFPHVSQEIITHFMVH